MLKMQLKIICAITYLFWKPCLKVIFRLRHSFHFIGRGWISLRLISLVFFRSASFSHGLWNGGLKRHLDFASLMFFLCTHPPLSRDLPLSASFLWGPQSRAKSHIFAVRRFCSSLVAEYPGYATRSAHSAARSWLWGCVCILPPLRISRFLKPLFVVWWGFPLHVLCFPAVRLAQVPASPWGQFLAPFAHRSRTPGHFCLQFLLHFDFVFDSWRYLIFFFFFNQTHTQNRVYTLCIFAIWSWGGDLEGAPNAWTSNKILAERLGLLKSFSLKFSSNLARWHWESLYSGHTGFLSVPCTEFALVLVSWTELELVLRIPELTHKISRNYVFMCGYSHIFWSM